MYRGQVRYALDANVLIAAHRNYYAPDLCPGFWECLAYHLQAGRLLVIDRVRSEIKYPDKLVEWMDEQVSSIAPVSTAKQSIIHIYRQMMRWVYGNDQFTDAAKDKFGRVADGWLAAYAKESGAVVVTDEVKNPDIKKDVPIPNLCDEFGVRCINTYAMLREIDAHFDWA